MIKVYTVEHCPYCSELKELLKKENIEFIEVDVNKPENEEEYSKLYEIAKCDQVPMVKVGRQILIPGTSFTSIQEAADLTKKFLG
jgi:glutaredoxin